MTELATNGSLQTLLCVGGTRLQREESCFGRWLIVERSAVLLEVSLKIFRRKSTGFAGFLSLKVYDFAAGNGLPAQCSVYT